MGVSLGAHRAREDVVRWARSLQRGMGAMVGLRRLEVAFLDCEVIASTADPILRQHACQVVPPNPLQCGFTVGEHAGRKPSVLSVEEPDTWHAGPGCRTVSDHGTSIAASPTPLRLRVAPGILNSRCPRAGTAESGLRLRIETGEARGVRMRPNQLTLSVATVRALVDVRFPRFAGDFVVWLGRL
jgi:hypothetical protein